MARPVMTCPAAVSRSTIARPLVSVASVRVSLTVRTKQRTDAGAAALCSAWLIRAHCSAAHATIRACGTPDATAFVLVSVCRRGHGRVSGAWFRGAARSVYARPRRRALGRANAEEADARREDRPADRAVVRVEFPQHRQRYVRDVDAAGARLPRRRLPRLRRVAAGAIGAAERRLRHGDPRPAVFGGVPDQPPAGAVRRCRC